MECTMPLLTKMKPIFVGIICQNFVASFSAQFCYFGVGVYLGDDTCTALPTGPAYKRELRPKRFFLLNSISLQGLVSMLGKTSSDITLDVSLYLLMSLGNCLFLNRKELSGETS